jgi:hypothetical protein
MFPSGSQLFPNSSMLLDARSQVTQGIFWAGVWAWDHISRPLLDWHRDLLRSRIHPRLPLIGFIAYVPMALYSTAVSHRPTVPYAKEFAYV